MNNDKVVRINEHIRKALRLRSAEVDVTMSDLANLFILEGLNLRNDHLQKLLAVQDNHLRRVGDVDGEAFQLE